MHSLTFDSPAKVNLLLSVHGPRPDGFHALSSIVVPLKFGDRLQVTLSEAGEDRLLCDDPAVPTGDSNLILRAAGIFRCRLGEALHFTFELKKRIPMGAGLGGGSGNAAVALRAMNALAGEPFRREGLLQMAAELGSDCPFFIDAVSAQMSGRGEVIEVLPEGARKRLRGRPIVLFRPDFGVPTAWAYGRMRSRAPEFYEQPALAQGRIESFLKGGALSELLGNSFEACVGQKYLAIACLLEQLRAAGHVCLMSGSGSCCFALPGNGTELAEIRAICQGALGEGSFFIETSVL
ncbi:MAG: 4-(cytidine 5'-diphospho)-2-C-methyl-D-erythritol kinase [Puniceicoccaceae bacterium]|nr:MAG: 4-(cytidine 5'-diphospho)-2-C-methyl-D-erythritol kinase [Puniceicoccaceae bacterium]